MKKIKWMLKPMHILTSGDGRGATYIYLVRNIVEKLNVCFKVLFTNDLEYVGLTSEENNMNESNKL